MATHGHGNPPSGGGNPPATPAPPAQTTPTPPAAPPTPPPPPTRPVRPEVAVDFDFRKQDCGIDYSDPHHPKRKWIVTIYAFDGNGEPATIAAFKIFFMDGSRNVGVGTHPGGRGFWSDTYTVETGNHEIRATLMEGGKDRFLTLYGVGKKQQRPFLTRNPLARGSGFLANLWRGIIGDDR